MKYLIAGLLLVTVITWSNTFYIKAKAELAQVLIERAWQETLTTGARTEPWSWADTWPVARIRSVDSVKDMYVLSGSHGTALAFGPGHVDGTVLPGEEGTSVIAGHRDTHFRFLEYLSTGDLLAIQSENALWHDYQVESIDIRDTSKGDSVDMDIREDRLLLITCYPFDAVEPGGPLRYVVGLRRL